MIESPIEDPMRVCERLSGVSIFYFRQQWGKKKNIEAYSFMPAWHRETSAITHRAFLLADFGEPRTGSLERASPFMVNRQAFSPLRRSVVTLLSPNRNRSHESDIFWPRDLLAVRRNENRLNQVNREANDYLFILPLEHFSVRLELPQR